MAESRVSLGEQASSVVGDAVPSGVVLVGGTAALSVEVEEQVRVLAPGASVERLWGETRVGTAGVAARRVLGDAAAAGVVRVVLANGWSLADVGAAAGLVAAGGADALLFVGVEELGAQARMVLGAYSVSTVYVVGGVAAVSDAVRADAAAAAGARSRRLGGATRVDTAGVVARAGAGDCVAAALVVNGWSDADVGAAAALSAALGHSVVLYAFSAEVPGDATRDAIADLAPQRLLLIGDTDTLSDAMRTQLPGASTARRVSDPHAAARLALRGPADDCDGAGGSSGGGGGSSSSNPVRRPSTTEPPTRQACTPADADATLASFELSEGSLSPAFDPSQNAYDTSVPAHTGWATVTAQPADPAATVQISPPDTNPIAPGHQIDLAAAPDSEQLGTTTIETAVTGTDGCTGDTYTITVTRPAATAFGRTPDQLIDTIDLFDIGIVWPRDIWSDGQTMWVANALAYTDWWVEDGVEGHPVDGLYAVDLATKTAVPERTINNIAHSENDVAYPTSAWSDGTTLWMLCRCGWVMAFDLDTLEPLEDRDYKVFYRDGTGYANYFGMWSDGTTMWMANATMNNSGIRAIDLATGERVEDKYIEMYSSGAHSGANGMWSDGKTIWIVYRTGKLVRAFDIESGNRQRHLEIDLRNSGFVRPSGIWSDGGVMWFSDQRNTRVDQQYGYYGVGQVGHDALLAYYLPTKSVLSNLTLGHHRVAGFDTWRTNYTAAFSTETTSVTVGAYAYHPDASITILPADTDPNREGHQVNLDPGENTVTVTAGTYNHTMTYTLTVTRDS